MVGRHATGRAQVEPIAALVATIAVCLAVGLYATSLDDAVPRVDRDLAGPTLDRIHEAATRGGVVDPARLPAVGAVGPHGHRFNVTLAVADERLAYGPQVPRPRSVALDRATRRVPVRTSPGRVRAGVLRVVVWS